MRPSGSILAEKRTRVSDRPDRTRAGAADHARGQLPPDSAAPWPWTIPRDDALGVIHGRHRDPFAVLGPQEVRDAGAAPPPGSGRIVGRVFVPGAVSVHFLGTVDGDGRDQPGTVTALAAIPDSGGLFEGVIPCGSLPAHPRYRVTTDVGTEFEFVDPFSYGPTLGDIDLHLFGEGTHAELWKVMGGRIKVHDGRRGVSFAVWAPNAWRVSVVGDFNRWDGRRHPMRFHPGVGVWDLFIPDLPEGTVYKFEILDQAGVVRPLKTDPYALAYEVRPNTAAVVRDISGYQWRDDAWMASRKDRHAFAEPMAVYEVHLGSWIRSPDHPEKLFSYRELADRLIPHVKNLGFTHIELLPITEHPYDGSWGYQSLGYFAPTSRHGSPEDFKAFVDAFHQAGIGVFVDWVPAHFPKDDHGLRLFDGSALYEHADPRQGEHPDWGTNIFNYGRNEVANFLHASALFWLDEYHIDGLRVDAVASMLYLDYGRKHGEWIPNRYGGHENLEAIAFLRRMNELIYARFPDTLTFAEESTSWPLVSKPTYVGGLGFSYKWNMGWMNDTLRYMHRDPIHRRYHQNDLTFSLMYAFSENFILPLSHDEVVHGKGALLDKMPGDPWRKFANLRLLFAWMWGHPGKKLLFRGGEFGQWQEWRARQSLDWHLLKDPAHQGIRNWVRDLNKALHREPALHEVDFEWTGFQWVDFHDAEASVLAFLRLSKTDGEELLFAFNLTPAVRDGYRLGVPAGGWWKEILNSDSADYGGGNVGNQGRVLADPQPCHEFPFSVELTLPPLACVVFKAERGE
jgi:1,4-alpha-glucan branching enzyme